MNEKKVREAIAELKSLICVRKRTLAALPTSARKNSLYNNEITALETAIEALEKQLPKKPKEYEDKYYACPVCGNILMYKWEDYPTKLRDKKEGLPCCLCCLQRLDWTEE